MEHKCTNCGAPIYGRIRGNGRHFCCLECKCEYHYLYHDLSASQLNLLAMLIERGGRGKIPSDSVALGSLSHHRIAPLITVIHVLPATCEVFAEITDRGRFWHSYKQNEKGVL